MQVGLCPRFYHWAERLLYINLPVACRALVATGVFSIVSSAVGYAGSQFKPIFLMLYLVAGTVSTTLQFLLVLGIFGAQDRVADEILAADSSSGTQHFDRWAKPASCVVPRPEKVPGWCCYCPGPWSSCVMGA